MMANEQAIRGLLVRQLGVSADLIEHVQLIDVALALGDRLGVSIPLEELGALHDYHDVMRAARDAVTEDLARRGGAVCVRARVCARHATIVRVGRLTAEFAASLADDVAHAPVGTAVEVSVPADLDDAAVALLHGRLAWLLGPMVPLALHRASDLGPDFTTTWDRMSQRPPRSCRQGVTPGVGSAGIPVAMEGQGQPHRRRRIPG